jgi:Cu+-exporting ATPase
MTCGSCVARVERALAGVPGVMVARVNLAGELARVSTDSSAIKPKSLIDAVRRAGYEAERMADTATPQSGTDRARSLQQRRQAVVQAIGLAAPILVLEWFGPHLASGMPWGHTGYRFLQGLLSLMLLLSPAGGPILVGGIRAMWHRAPNMDSLVAVGTLAAFVGSVIATVLGMTAGYAYEAVALILSFINVGKYIETRARQEASDSVAVLAKRMPRDALRVTNGGTERVSIDDVSLGDHLKVEIESLVPVDGLVVSGRASIDTSALTGEFVPRTFAKGDHVSGGTLVIEGSIVIEATSMGIDSAVGRIRRAVESAQMGNTRMQRLADRVAGVFVPMAMTIALVTLIGWLMTGHGWPDAIRSAVSVLVIACPCAMGLATPTAVMVATGSAAQRGILVRDAESLERAGAVDVVLFDKTGTLTSGSPEVREVVVHQGFGTESESHLLQMAGSAVRYSQHPLSKAVVARAESDELSLQDPDSFESIVGQGVRAVIHDQSVLVGSVSFLRAEGVDLSPVAESIDSLQRQARSVVLVAVDGLIAGVVGLADAIRQDAGDAVLQLRESRLMVAMVTGDHEQTARAVADVVGIDEVHAQSTPDEKMAVVREFQRIDRRVAFVGDGVNDAPALTAADVGIAFAAGTDVALESADITLVGDNLRSVSDAIRLARRSVRVIKQNLFWAFFYNLSAVPLAAFGKISPGLAAAAMMVSSITVVLNSLRLRSQVHYAREQTSSRDRK